MTTDLKDVLINLDSKIAEVYDLDLAKEMTDIYVDLSDRVNEFSRQYWKLVKALAKTEKDRDDLLRELKVEKEISKARSEDRKIVFEIAMDKIQDERDIQDKLNIEKDQAEYDRDYYKNEVEWLRNEVEWHRKQAENERRLRVAAEYEKEFAEMKLLGQEVRYDLND